MMGAPAQRTVLYTMERLSKRHFTKDVKGDHFKPLSHVPLRRSRVGPQDVHEAIDAILNDGFLLS